MIADRELRRMIKKLSNCGLDGHLLGFLDRRRIEFGDIVIDSEMDRIGIYLYKLGLKECVYMDPEGSEIVAEFTHLLRVPTASELVDEAGWGKLEEFCKFLRENYVGSLKPSELVDGRYKLEKMLLMWVMKQKGILWSGKEWFSVKKGEREGNRGCRYEEKRTAATGGDSR